MIFIFGTQNLFWILLFQNVFFVFHFFNSRIEDNFGNLKLDHSSACAGRINLGLLLPAPLRFASRTP